MKHEWLETVLDEDGNHACAESRIWAADYPTLSAAWVACDNPQWMIWALVQLKVPDAQLRKLACRFVRETPLADGRTVWDLLTDERSRNAVEVAERYAECDATDSELATARAAAWAAWAAARAAARDAARDAAGAAAWAAWAAARAAARDAARDAAGTAQSAFIREMFPNPFQPLAPERIGK